jgi:probable F420-dependent oxidoreductase
MRSMKIRFGVGLGTEVGPAELPAIVDQLEAAGIDSLWFSELVYSPAVDPVVGMTFALARTRRLKVGTSVAVLPGRHPVLVAKELASLAALAPKRVLPVFGLRSALPAERDLFPVPDGRRAAVFDEALTLLRTVLDSTDPVTFTGDHHRVRDAVIQPKPIAPLDIWIGGSSPAAYRRIGALGDGWLGSFLTPQESGRARTAIIAAAERAGRVIEADHYGINLAVGTGDLPDAVVAAVRARRPDLDPTALVATDWPTLHRQLDAYIAAGLTKFVVRPLGAAGNPADFVERFARELLPRQN